MRKINEQEWQDHLVFELNKYMPAVRKWWADVESFQPEDTGCYPVEDAPPGLMYRFTRSSLKSPLKGLQAFPFVLTCYLPFLQVPGGILKMITRITTNLEIDGYRIIEKHGLPSIYHTGQFLAFVPANLNWHKGAWLYCTPEEIQHLTKGHICKTLYDKALLRI